MRLSEKLFTRRRNLPRFAALPPRTRHRLALACEELTQAENDMARRLGLATPPRLVIVDEEEAVILLASDRAETL